MSSTATLAAYLGNLFTKARLGFTNAADQAWNIYDGVGTPDNPDSYYAESRELATVKAPQTPLFKGADELPENVVDLSDSYVAVKVGDAATDLQTYTTGNESDLGTVTPYENQTAELAAFINRMDALMTAALGQLGTLTDSIDYNFTSSYDTFYAKLWTAGFVTLLQEYSERDTDFIATAVTDRIDTAISTVTTTVNALLNRRGFQVPQPMVASSTQELERVGSFSHADANRNNAVMIKSFMQQVYATGLNAEEVSEGFTKLINNMEVEFDKFRQAAVIAECNASVNMFKGNIDTIAAQMRLLLESAGIAGQYLSVENEKLQATQSISDAWTVWTNAQLAVESLTDSINATHFGEVDGKLKIAEADSRLRKIAADLAINKELLLIQQDISGKELEVDQNSVEVIKRNAQIAISAAMMQKWQVDLDSYIAEFTADFAKVQANVAAIKPLSDISKYAGDLMGAIVNESSMTIYK